MVIHTYIILYNHIYIYIFVCVCIPKDPCIRNEHTLTLTLKYLYIGTTSKPKYILYENMGPQGVCVYIIYIYIYIERERER